MLPNNRRIDASPRSGQFQTTVTVALICHKRNRDKAMLLKIEVDCPLCAADFNWIYDTDAKQSHRGAVGCPGGCTAIQQIRVRELSESDAKEFIDNERHPENNLDL